MLGSDRLRALLADLARTRRAPGGQGAGAFLPGAAEPEASPATGSTLAGTGTADAPGHFPPWKVSEPVGIEAFLPGGEWRNGRGAVYVHERLRSEVERPELHWGRLDTPSEDEEELHALAAGGLTRALFLDLETGGLASSPVFLAGTMHWNGCDFVMRQYFARHYGEEPTLLCALNEACRRFDFLVTFNGKSYDAPFLRARALVHGVPLELPERHVDLLHPARRRWKERLPDCRLQTLELYVCRRKRSGDVPSDEVPALYHDFVRRGDPYRLVPVFHHNLLDVITMGDVLRELCAPARPRRRASWFEGLEFA